MRDLLGGDRPLHSSPVFQLWRSASVVAADQPRAVAVCAVPAAAVLDRVLPGDRSIHRCASRDRSCAEVRRLSIARSAPGRADARQRRPALDRRGRGGPRPAASAATACARLQSSRGSGPAPRAAGAAGAPARPRDTVADRFAGGAAARECPQCLCAAQALRRTRPPHRHRRRRVHDWGDVGSVRAGTAGSGRARGQRADGSASRVAAARMTSAETSRLARPPSMRIQPGAWA